MESIARQLFADMSIKVWRLPGSNTSFQAILVNGSRTVMVGAPRAEPDEALAQLLSILLTNRPILYVVG